MPILHIRKRWLFASNGEIKEKVDGADGTGWEYHFYNLDGTDTLIYKGYTYGIKEIEPVQKILEEYTFVD